MRINHFLRVFIGPTAALALAACGGGDGSRAASSEATEGPGGGSSSSGGGTSEPLPEGVFESANLAGPSPSQRDDSLVVGESASDSVAGGTAAAPGAATSSPNGGVADSSGMVASPAPADPSGDGNLVEEGESAVAAARAIEEADIIKLEGDRLYALSTYGGLSVIDVSNPDALRLLGRHRTTATPFEMYVRGDNVFVLYNGYGEYTFEEDTDSWTFYQTSYVISLDTSDPASISEAQKFEIAGYISDSRLVGDALYVVAFDDASCYRCGTAAETNVMSLNVSDPTGLEKVDELTFPEKLDEYSWRRSLSATDERLYIAGPRYGNGAEPEGSVIQVVDITDPSGEMQEGDSVEVAGQINNRWQMDEYDGVLRVISQPLWWVGGAVPVVETFSIESSDTLTALGRTELVLPRPETLQAVRFDGTRAYAITFEQTDPLFTIDLSEPATPLQMGELEMPGWVYHMEPRGDRVIGLGFDQGNAEGSLTVSIFDVSNLREPTMIQRVNFGGEWAQLAEDQDRIHKSFQVLDDKELILVPFSGYDYSRVVDECGGQYAYVSGVQMIDWVDDTLALRGIAPAKGQARRAFFVEDRLLTMSDERLESFDVNDRDVPESTSMVELAQIVNQLAVAGDSVVRLGNDWWANTMEATVSSLDELLAFEPGVKVDLADINRYTCTSESWLHSVMSGGDNVYFLYQHYDWSNNGNYKQELRVRTLDVSNPDEPEIAGEATLDFYPSYGYGYVPGMVNNGTAALAVEDSLVFAQHDTQYNELGFVIHQGYTLEVVDFSDASKPVRSSLNMPASLGSTGLLQSGDIVATSHFEASPSNPNTVRFYLDRADLSDPSDPELLAPVNIPGSLLAYDHESSRALTLDYQWLLIEDISPQQCYEEEYGQFITPDPSIVDYVNARGPCEALRFTLHLVEIDGDSASIVSSHEIEDGLQVTNAAIGDDRVFLGTGARAPYYYGGGGIAVDIATPVSSAPGGAIAPGLGWYPYYYYYTFQTTEAKVLVASGLAGGDLEVASAVVDATQNFYGFSGLLAKGKKAVVATGWQGRLSVIDASDASDPVIHDSAELGGSVYDLDLVGDVAVAALGSAGVQTISLAD